MKRRLVDFEAVKGQRKCQYCWQNIAFNMARTRNGRRWKCNECIEGATKAYDMEQIKANA